MVTQPLINQQVVVESIHPKNGFNNTGQTWNFVSRDDFQSELVNALQNAYPIPHGSVFFGMAEEDGLPILLNTDDPETGAILIAGSPLSGKTAILQVMASSLSYTHKPNEIQFAVITSRAWEWTEWENSRYCAGIFSSEDHRTATLLDALEIWMTRPIHDQAFLLFVDRLELMERLDLGTQDKLHNLFRSGPSSKIWPITTLGNENLNRHSSYLSLLKTRLLCISSGSKSSIFECRYLMRENSKSLRFSLFG